jgi:signal transduction histidine kinase
MDIKEAIDQVNIFKQCKKYNLPLHQCPQFLFLIMGIVIGITAIISYALGTRYVVDPGVVALIVLVMTSFLLAVSFIIIRSLERIAEANRLKTEFVSVVSHQLRSPLSNLKWSADLVCSGRLGGDNGKQKEYLDIIKENVERMEELVSDLLMVSRIEQGKLPFKKSEFSLVKITEEIIEKFKAFADASNIKIFLKAEESLPNIESDLSQIKSVIENLLDNAVKYIEGAGEVNIFIKKERDKLIFEIKDSGLGIPEKDQKHIFQKFFRSENAARHQTQGSGLGLYIAKSFVNVSGGKIWFKSKIGEGTTFWLALPIKSKGR